MEGRRGKWQQKEAPPILLDLGIYSAAQGYSDSKEFLPGITTAFKEQGLPLWLSW